jgi:hypothetical protein
LLQHGSAHRLREIQETLDRAQIPPSKQARARDAILRERLSSKRIRGIWLLRLPPGANFWEQLRHAHIPRRLLALAGAHAIQYALWILAWYIVDRNVLRGGAADRGWLIPWALLLLTLVPLRVLITRLQGWVAIGAGALLKQRLFFGSLRLDPDSLRHQGAGQLLGRVLESEAVEALALSGGFLALVALIEIIAAIFVLAAGAGGLAAIGACSSCGCWSPRRSPGNTSAQSRLDRRSPGDDARSGGEHGRASHAPGPTSGRSLARRRRRSARKYLKKLPKPWIDPPPGSSPWCLAAGWSSACSGLRPRSCAA